MTKFNDILLEPQSVFGLSLKPSDRPHLNELTEDKEREGKKKSTKEDFKAKLKVTAVKAE